MKFGLKPFDMVSRDPRTLAESAGGEYDSQEGRVSHLGGFLSLSALGVIIWYAISQSNNMSWEDTITTQSLAAYGEQFDLDILCTSPRGCLVAVSWGDENVEALTSSASYMITSGDGTSIELTDHVASGSDSHVRFRSRCIELKSQETLSIDNFIWASNPELSYVHVYYDWGSSPMGAEIPGSYSASGHPLKLLDLAYTLDFMKTTDSTVEPPRTTKLWSTTYGAQLTDNCSPADDPECKLCDPSSIHNDAGSDPDVRRAELYLNSKTTDVSVTFTDPMYSMAGEVGGVMDLLAYGVTIIMVVYWCVKARFGGWGPLSRQKANKEKRDAMMKHGTEGIGFEQDIVVLRSGNL